MAPTIISLDRQRRFAWGMYYRECSRSHDDDYATYNTIKNAAASTPEIPVHVLNEFKEMLEALRKKIECPVCLEVIEHSVDIEFTPCGHKYCGECLKRLEKCAICRKPCSKAKKARVFR